MVKKDKIIYKHLRVITMIKAYKYRIYPTSEQRLYLAKTFGCTRFVYNQMLADRIKSYEENIQRIF